MVDRMRDVGRVSDLSAVVGGENFIANDRADGESLGADSAFFDRFRRSRPSHEALCAKFFLHCMHDRCDQR